MRQRKKPKKQQLPPAARDEMVQYKWDYIECPDSRQGVRGPFFAEFYNPGKDEGICFLIEGVSLIGDILRVRLPERPGKKDEGWMFTPGSPQDGWTFKYRGKAHKFSDFGCSPGHLRVFDRISIEDARKQLIEQ